MPMNLDDPRPLPTKGARLETAPATGRLEGVRAIPRAKLRVPNLGPASLAHRRLLIDPRLSPGA